MGHHRNQGFLTSSLRRFLTKIEPRARPRPVIMDGFAVAAVVIQFVEFTSGVITAAQSASQGGWPTPGRGLETRIWTWGEGGLVEVSREAALRYVNLARISLFRHFPSLSFEPQLPSPSPLLHRPPLYLSSQSPTQDILPPNDNPA